MRIWFFATLAIIFIITASANAALDFGPLLHLQQQQDIQVPISPVTEERQSTKPLAVDPTSAPHSEKVDAIPQEAGAGSGHGAGGERPAMMMAVVVVGFVGVGFGLGMGL